jgi:two-component system, cell cycle response regulator
MAGRAKKTGRIDKDLEHTAALLKNSTLKNDGTLGPEAYRVPTLTFLSGDSLGKEIPLLQEQIIIGRGEESDVLVLDPSVSRKHIQLTCRKVVNGDSTQDISVTLRDLGSKNGTLVNYRTVRRAILNPGDKIVMGSVILKFELRDLAEQNFFDEIFRMATTDGLTGLLNKSTISRALNEEKTKQRRYKREYSVILLDLDNFKKLNDSQGHIAGDLVLKAVALAVRRNLREQDRAGRFGGEEFLLLLPETSREGADSLAERIRLDIESMAGREAGLKGVVITASLGVASSGGEGAAADDIVHRADTALYQAKNLGKNRVVHWRLPAQPVQE